MSEEAWTRRYKAVYGSATSHLLSVSILIFGLAYMISYMIYAIDPGVNFEGLVILTWLVFITVCFHLYWAHRYGHMGGRAAPGVYEQGLQLDFMTFLPYSEVKRIVLNFDDLGREVVELHPRYGRKEMWKLRHKHPWVIIGEYLGEEGVEELRDRVHAPGSP